jgi:diguanylate cyclase (GGDEF)-like protein/PAS domain S-box-containing protein
VEEEHRPVVLVVGDGQSEALSATESLAQADMEVIQANSAQVALQRIRQQPPDGVLIDAQLPGVNGFETCAAIRAMPAGGLLPIIMVTAADDLESIERCYRAGATDFITTPINAPLLPHRMRHILRAGTMKREAYSLRGLLKRILDSVPVRVFWKDLRLHYLGCNRAFAEDAGFASTWQVVGLTDAALPWAAQAELFERDEREVIRTGRPRLGYEHSRVCDSGKHIDAQTNTVPLHGEHGRIIGVLGTYEDITARKKTEAEIRFLAQRDTLTGLPNRALFEDRLRHAMANADRRKRLLSLMFIDLDHFKRVNDSLGHHRGDELLVRAAERLKRCVRRSDTVARLGGDEFTVILEMLERIEHCTAVASKIVRAFQKPFHLDGHTVFATATIGIAVYPLTAESSHEILRRADTAMYRAKEEGRNRYRLYSADMDASTLQRLETENSLREALERNQFELWYQPQYDMGTEELVGFEALLRWNHPERGVLLPQQFLKLLEETGLIMPVGEWALRTACRQAAAWRDQGREPARVAVNLSSRQVNDPELVDKVTAALDDAHLEPSRLELEITENCLVQDIQGVGAILETLKGMGVKVALDDFGTGYHSLDFLKHFALDTLKIDRSFIEGLPDDADDIAITTAIIALGRNLGLRVVAEGVESGAQLAHLRAQGCDTVQGFLMSRPQPVQDIWPNGDFGGSG